MTMGKRKKTPPDKPAFLWGYSAALLFAILNLLAYYCHLPILKYLSVAPAMFVIFLFIASVTDSK